MNNNGLINYLENENSNLRNQNAKYQNKISGLTNVLKEAEDSLKKLNEIYDMFTKIQIKEDDGILYGLKKQNELISNNRDVFLKNIVNVEKSISASIKNFESIVASNNQSIRSNEVRIMALRNEDGGNIVNG